MSDFCSAIRITGSGRRTCALRAVREVAGKRYCNGHARIVEADGEDWHSKRPGRTSPGQRARSLLRRFADLDCKGGDPVAVLVPLDLYLEMVKHGRVD